MSIEQPLTGIRGWLIDAPEYGGRLRSWSDGAMISRQRADRLRWANIRSLAKKPRDQPVRWLHSNRVAFFPGLIDLHAHVPQYPAVARGQSELLPWLRQHIFPLEREFTGPRGRREAAAFFAELARQGTTTAMLYTAIYEDSCEAAFEAAAKSGLRIIMGKMMMDVGSYGALQPSKILSISLHETERLCRKWNGAAGGLIEYAISPRFAVSCSEKLLRSAGELAAATGAYLQTHLAEKPRRNREGKTSIRVGEGLHGRLRPVRPAYTAHRARALPAPQSLVNARRWRPAARMSRTARRQTCSCVAASCHSTTMRAAGLRIGLGSDVAAGPELNLWRVMRGAIEAQKARSFYETNVQIPSPPTRCTSPRREPRTHSAKAPRSERSILARRRTSP
jgi:guanine deaminase